MLHELGQTCRLLFINILQYVLKSVHVCCVVENQDTPWSTRLIEEKSPHLIRRWPYIARELAIFVVREGHVRYFMFIRQVANMSLRAIGALLASPHVVEHAHWPGCIHDVQQLPRHL